MIKRTRGFTQVCKIADHSEAVSQWSGLTRCKHAGSRGLAMRHGVEGTGNNHIRWTAGLFVLKYTAASSTDEYLQQTSISNRRASPTDELPQQTSFSNRRASSTHRSSHTSIPFKKPLRQPITDITDTPDADHEPRVYKAPQNL